MGTTPSGSVANESEPANTSPAHNSEPAEPTVKTTTTTPTTTTAVVVDEFVVEMVCHNGHINEVSVPHSTLGPLDFSPIDDVVNGIDACEGPGGGLASIQFMGCDIDPFLIEIDAIDGAIPDFGDYDMCEHDG
ncbi:MAG: hypothetical protein GY773_16735 [Actinomycetia bacterium]|nr:hypothetical protein [Actinomycetes bacterium]